MPEPSSPGVQSSLDKVADRLPYLPYKMTFLKRLGKYLKTSKFIGSSSIPA